MLINFNLTKTMKTALPCNNALPFYHILTHKNPALGIPALYFAYVNSDDAYSNICEQTQPDDV
jgi:hypothetical protein